MPEPLSYNRRPNRIDWSFLETHRHAGTINIPYFRITLYVIRVY